MAKQLIWVTLCLVVAFSSATFAAERPLADITIGITGHDWGANSYFSTYEQAFEDYCGQLGVNYIKLDPRAKVAQQINQVEDLIQKKVDVIIIWPVSGKAIIPVLKKAQTAGIPVLITNSPVDESGYPLVEGFAGPNNVLEGKYAAELMAEALEGKGKVVEIMGLPGYVTAIERSQGFHEEIKNYPGIEILETQPGDWDREKAQKVMENYLVKYGPEDFDGVYVADDNMGMGAVNALKATGRLKDVVVTSACSFGEGYDAMQRGEIYGSVYQSPKEDAIIAVDTAVQLAQGRDVEFFNYFDTPKLTRDNMDQFERPPF